MTRYSDIPDHSPKALREACEAAMLCLAFQRLEEEEIAMLKQKIKDQPKTTGDRARFARMLTRKIRRERGRALLTVALPRAAQAAACLIAVLTIGAGVALAASQEARSWAAGVLTGREIVSAEENFFVGESLNASLTDGVVLDERLLLMEGGEALSLRDSVDAEPVLYVWKDRGARKLSSMEACGGELYALYEDGVVDNFGVDRTGVRGAISGTWDSYDRIGLGRVQLASDGSFTVEELARFDGEALYGTGVSNCHVRSIAGGNGRLYFIANHDVTETGYFSFSNGRQRLFAFDLASHELAELPLPIVNENSPDCYLFNDGEVFIAASSNDLSTQVFRIGADNGFTKLAEFPAGQRADSFAYRASTDTLYYQLGSSIYAAPHFDIASAQRVALSGGNSGRGLLIGENSYVIVGGNAEVFDFDIQPGAVNELVVNDLVGASLSDAARAANPNLALAEDPTNQENLAEYAQKLISGESGADLVRMFCDDDGMLAREGWGKPIADEVIRAEIDRMPEGVRRYVTKDGAYIGFPSDTFWAYSDVEIDQNLWLASGRGEDELPKTWLELAHLLDELSHSDGAEKYTILTGSDEALSPTQFLLSRMANGFARSWAARGEAPDFDGADFREAIEAIQSIDFGSLRYAANSEDQERALISLSGDIYGPRLDETETTHSITLKIRPEDAKVSRGSCYIARVNPDSSAEKAAYSCMRSWFSDRDFVFDRVNHDFVTPAAELAEQSEGIASAEQIEHYREQVGDVWPAALSEAAMARKAAALAAYVNGECDFATLAEALNAIYANG